VSIAPKSEIIYHSSYIIQSITYNLKLVESIEFAIWLIN